MDTRRRSDNIDNSDTIVIYTEGAVTGDDDDANALQSPFASANQDGVFLVTPNDA